MKKVKVVKLKSQYILVLKILGFILCLILGVFIFYAKQIYDLKKLDYSKEASNKILFSKKKDYVVSIGFNKTLNKAFESDKYKEEYLDNYSKIEYVDQEHLIENINKLIKIGYSNSDINIILSHGNDKSVSEFTKREKIKYLDEFFSVSYAKIDYYDRYVNYSNETGEDEESTVLFVNLNLDKEDYEDAIINNDFSIDMLINKHFGVNESFSPSNLADIDLKYTKNEELKANKVAINSFVEMYNAASHENLELVINSAYRSYDEQVEISNYYLNLYGQNYVNKYVARPGFSEHHTGLCFDIGSRNTNVFANSKEYEWMQENAYKYGFILRYPKKYESVTQFRNEPWHYRYVGKDIAKVIYEENIPFEEYYAIYLDK